MRPEARAAGHHRRGTDRQLGVRRARHRRRQVRPHPRRASSTIVIILVFLHDIRATFIAALAIPTSIVATFALAARERLEAVPGSPLARLGAVAGPLPRVRCRSSGPPRRWSSSSRAGRASKSIDLLQAALLRGQPVLLLAGAPPLARRERHLGDDPPRRPALAAVPLQIAGGVRLPEPGSSGTCLREQVGAGPVDQGDALRILARVQLLHLARTARAPACRARAGRAARTPPAADRSPPARPASARRAAPSPPPPARTTSVARW